MADVRIPAGSRIFIQSSATGAEVITGVTNAKPPVITYSTTAPTDGGYVALVDMYGMAEMEDALLKVSNINTTAKTFEAEDQDSTGYGTFESGMMSNVALNTEIRVATGFTMTGGEQSFAEYSLLWDTVVRKKPTTQTASQVDIPCIWDPRDPGMIALQTYADSTQKTGVKILLPDGLEILFFGYVGASGLPTAADISTIMTTNVSIVMATRPRYIFP